MKYYDAATINAYILRQGWRIESIDAGIREDWAATSERIYENRTLTLPLTGGRVKIGGIDGSMWGTPVMRVLMIDGTVEVVRCYRETPPMLKPHRIIAARQMATEAGVRTLGWDGRLYGTPTPSGEVYK